MLTVWMSSNTEVAVAVDVVLVLVLALALALASALALALASAFTVSLVANPPLGNGDLGDLNATRRGW